MNLPNSLTVTRIFLVPLLVVVLLTKFEGREIVALEPAPSGDAVVSLAPGRGGLYACQVQVADRSGRWSNVLQTRIAVDSAPAGETPPVRWGPISPWPRRTGSLTRARSGRFRSGGPKRPVTGS